MRKAKTALSFACATAIALICISARAGEAPKPAKPDDIKKMAVAYADELIAKMIGKAETGNYDGAIGMVKEIPAHYEPIIKSKIDTTVKMLKDQATEAIDNQIREIDKLLNEELPKEAEEKYYKLRKIKFAEKGKEIEEVAKKLTDVGIELVPPEKEPNELDIDEASQEELLLLNNKAHQKYIQIIEKTRSEKLADMARRYREGQNSRFQKINQMKGILSELEHQAQPTQAAKDRAALEIKKFQANIKFMEEEEKKIAKEIVKIKGDFEKEIEKAYKRVADANREMTAKIEGGEKPTEEDLKVFYQKALQGK